MSLINLDFEVNKLVLSIEGWEYKGFLYELIRSIVKLINILINKLCLR